MGELNITMNTSNSSCFICLEKLNLESTSSSGNSNLESRQEICVQFSTSVSKFIQMNKKLDIDISQLNTLTINDSTDNIELSMCCENCFVSLEQFCKNYEQLQNLHKDLLQVLFGIFLKKTESQKVHAQDDDDVNSAVNDFHFAEDDDDHHGHDDANFDVKPQTADDITVLKVLERPSSPSARQAEVPPPRPLRFHNVGAEVHQCQVCQKEFKYKTSLTSHQVKNHTVFTDPEMAKKSCHLCPAKFDRRTYLARHLLNYHKEKKFVCELPDCGKRFFWHKNLVIHQQMHQNPIRKPKPKMFQCDLCPKQFAVQKSLLNHMTKVHENPEAPQPSQTKCDICQATFDNSGLLTRHLINDHKLEKKFVCTEPNCGKRFFRKRYLLRHRPVHLNPPDDPKPHKCHLCPGKFALREDLCVHKRRVHGDQSAIRRHMCDLCGKRFATPGELLRHHQVSHNPETPEKVKVTYTCDFEGCGKIFNRKDWLRDHALSHTTEKTQQCDHCGEAFKRASTLRKHMLQNHPEVPVYQCKDCGERFHRFAQLKHHREKFHPSKNQKLGLGKWRVRKRSSPEPTHEPQPPEAESSNFNYFAY